MQRGVISSCEFLAKRIQFSKSFSLLFLTIKVKSTQQTEIDLIFPGYSGEPQFQGTYQNSFTWFVASVLGPGGHDRVPRKVLQFNVHADITFKQHIISWRADCDDPTAVEWINSIQGGDTIHIIPLAAYQAWINFVQSADIEVHYILAPPAVSFLELSRPLTKSSSTVPYRVLNKETDEVRLILLHSGSVEDPILCTIAHTSLKAFEIANYEALSYCWGDHRQRQNIKVAVTDAAGSSDFAMSITLSLYLALLKLRPRTGPARILWVDSICINQNDLDERSSQVSLMRDVYHNARRVVVWLGQGTMAMYQAIKTLNTISQRYEEIGTSDQVSSQTAQLHSPLMERVDKQKHAGQFDFLQDWKVFESPWFNRTWVVQEAFNAKETIFYCGDCTLTLAMMLRVNKCISMIQGLPMNGPHKIRLPPIYDDLFHAKIASGSARLMQLGILEILIKGLDLDATDPRDKVFAILQFGKETQDMSLLPSDLVPDYRKPASEVFASFTKWWIVEHQSLRILSAIHALEGRTWQDGHWGTPLRLNTEAAERPTWSWWHRGRSYWAIGILGLKTDAPYRASADTKPDLSLITGTKQKSVLSLAGITICTIEGYIPYPYFSPPPSLESLHRAYVGIFDPLNLTGKWQSQVDTEKVDTYVFSDDASRMMFHCDAHKEFSKKTNAVECNTSSFFTTKRGLVGLCPSAAKIGDVIVVLYGGSVPYVLREVATSDDGHEKPSKRYEYIGECFLESYMEGRAIDEQKQEGLLTQVFSLV